MWSEAQFQSVRARLTGDGADDLILFMYRKSLSMDAGDCPPATVDAARALGWVEGPQDNLTVDGRLAADSCREYQFWRDRGRKLPFEDALPDLVGSYFHGRRVLEIGAGAGVNLMALAAAGAEVSGVDPVGPYIQMNAIFSAREELDPVDIRRAAAEALPFGDDTADLILCVTAHQYFDFHVALAEITRVLRPGGEVIIVGGTLASFLRGSAGELLQGVGPARAYIITLINTLSYMFLGKRAISGQNDFSTARPVYPPVWMMRRWLRQARFRPAGPVRRAGPERIFHSVLAD